MPVPVNSRDTIPIGSATEQTLCPQNTFGDMVNLDKKA